MGRRVLWVFAVLLVIAVACYWTMERRDHKIARPHVPSEVVTERSPRLPDTPATTTNAASGAPGTPAVSDEVLASRVWLSGKVVLDATDAPAADTEVIVVTSPDIANHTRTDEHGVFVFDALLPDTRYVVRAVDTSRGLVSAETLPVVLKPGEQKDDAVLRLVSGASLSGKVLTKERGRPLEGAEVRLTGPENSPVVEICLATARTNEDGVYSIELFSPGHYRASCTPPPNRTIEGGSLVREVSPAPGEAVTGVDFAFQEGTSIAGHVFSSAGMPVCDAVIRVGHTDTSEEQTTKSGVDGQYYVAGLLPDLEYRLVVEAQGYAIDGRTEHVPSAGRRGVDFRLADEAAVSGRVVNEKKEPLSSVLLRSIPDDAATAWRSRYLVASTNEEGEFTFSRLVAGEYYLTARILPSQSFESHTDESRIPGSDFSVSIGQHVTGLEIVLPTESHFIEGRVLNERREPIANVQVSARKAEAADDYASTKTGVTGVFRIEGFHSDSMDVEFNHPEYATWKIRCLAATSDLEVILPSGASVSGVVIDADTDRPIPEATITAMDVQIEDGMNLAPSHEGLAIVATTDSAGAYTLVFVPPGTAMIRAEAEGYKTTTRDNVEVRSGTQTVNVDFSLRRVGRLEGTVVFGQLPGYESAQCTILASRLGGAGETTDLSTGKPDEGGRYAMDMTVGMHRVRAELRARSKAGFAALVQDAEVSIRPDETTYQDFRFEDTGIVRGSLSLHQDEQECIVCLLDQAVAPPDDDNDLLRISGYYFRQEARATGEFSLFGVSPGDYNLVALAGVPRRSRTGPMRRIVQPVRVVPGQVQEINLTP